MLFQRDKDQNEGEKKPSTLGFLFNPGIGKSIHPIGESIGMFVRLIALIFASNGLFPKDHPALNNTNIRLTMADVISTAWSGLSFTKQGIPRVVLFSAVVGCLVFSALLVLTLIATLAMGSAHAADTSTSSMFDTPDITNDIAHGWIGYLFKGETIANLSVSNNGQWYQVPQSQRLQEALKTALAFYSNGILVFAGVILLYHLMMMIVETAHQGVPFGKSANQIWAPLRLVVAIGLLVPISGGLNTGQYIMIQMADWGSGLASQTWATFLDAFANQTSAYVAPPTPSVLPVVRKMAKVYGCVYLYNKYVQMQFDSTSETVPEGDLIPEDGVSIVEPYGEKVEFKTANPNKGDCGGYYIPKLATGTSTGSSNLDPQILTQIYANSQQAFKTISGKIKAIAVKNADYYAFWHDFSNASDTITSNSELMELVSDYRKALSSSNSSLKYDTNSALTALASDWSRLGWAAAGAWLNLLARSLEGVLNAPADSLPAVTVPGLSSGPVISCTDSCSPEQKTVQSLDHFDTWVDQGYKAGGAFTENDFKAMGIDASYKSPAFTGKGDNGFAEFIAAALVEGFSTIRNSNTGTTSVSTDPVPWVSIGTTVNPFNELVELGHRQFTASFYLLDSTIGLGAGATVMNGFVQNVSTALAGHQGSKKWVNALGQVGQTGVSTVTGPAVSTILGIIALIAAMLFTVGVTLSFFVPLLPFTLFFFNTVSWGVSLFEAVVSMPLLALAHLSTQGEGLPGSMARQGYFFIFAIFLRPVLMVFGLIAGILIFYVSLALLNLTFSIAMKGSGSYVSTGAYGVITQVIFNIIYAMFVYICANTAFKTINFFPEHAMNWMSARGPSTERMGDKALMNQTSSMITAYGFKETVGSMYSRAPVFTGAATQTGSVGRNSSMSAIRWATNGGGGENPSGAAGAPGQAGPQVDSAMAQRAHDYQPQDLGAGEENQALPAPPTGPGQETPPVAPNSPSSPQGGTSPQPEASSPASSPSPSSSPSPPGQAPSSVDPNANAAIVPDLMSGRTSTAGTAGAGNPSVAPSPFSPGQTGQNKPSPWDPSRFTKSTITPPSGPDKGGK